MELLYTVTVDGTELDSKTTELDLRGKTDIAAFAEKLAFFPNLQSVLLDDSASMADVKTVAAAAPHAVIDYTFTLFGKTINSADETVEFENIRVGGEKPEDILSLIKEVVFDDVNGDGHSTGKGEIGHIIWNGLSVK